MNTYVIIARHLGTISGEKIYSYNKMRYLLSTGWRVVFLTGKRETAPFEEDPNYSHYVYPALTYAPDCYTEREIQKTVESIAKKLSETNGDKCIIETDAANRAAWGELIAKRVGAKHLVFLLQETHHYDEETRKFLRFKYDRHELAGISIASIGKILADEQIERRDDTRFLAFSQNCIEDCEDLISPRLPEDASYTFGSIGRLDKRCVPAILNAFKEYANMHPEGTYNVVLIGGAVEKAIYRKSLSELKKCTNVHVVVTGYLYPIPLSLIRNIDLFVSTAGSSTSSYRFHRPTVRVHPITGEPCGIVGLDDLNGRTMYDVMPDTTICECMERALKNADKIEYVYNGYDDYYERMKTEFDRQLKIADIPCRVEYYDEMQLMKIKTTRIRGNKLHQIVGHLIGAKGLNMFIALCKTISGNF